MKPINEKFENPETDDFDEIEFVASSSECTGLTPSAVLDEDEADAYAQLYAVHKQKPIPEKRR